MVIQIMYCLKSDVKACLSACSHVAGKHGSKFDVCSSESLKRGNGMAIHVTYLLKSEYNLFVKVEH